MSGARQLRVGNIRPDGSREITVSDGGGVLLHGELGPEPTGQAPASPRLSLDDITGLVAMAGRAPSVHNTQPWWFRACGNVVELYADEDRLLRQIDPARREMVISCGAALYGLRLGLRKLGYLPIVEVLPDPDRPTLIARVRPGDLAQLTRDESELLAALPHRHTHRGPFTPGEVPDRLVAGMRMDALAEGAELVLIEQPGQFADLVELVLAAASEQAADREIAAELLDWVHASGSQARDGIRAQARLEEPAADGGERHRPTECSQMPTLGPPLGPDMHLFRQDTDSYLLSVAAGAGGPCRQGRGARAHPSDGHGARPRRPAPRLRAARLLPGRAPRHGPRPQRRGL